MLILLAKPSCLGEAANRRRKLSEGWSENVSRRDAKKRQEFKGFKLCVFAPLREKITGVAEFGANDNFCTSGQKF